MKTNIDYILQIDGQNLLQVVYKSGANRFIWLGDSYYVMTKTQQDFMNNSMKVEHKTRYWFEGRSTTYWLDKDNPNEAILAFCRRSME